MLYKVFAYRELWELEHAIINGEKGLPRRAGASWAGKAENNMIENVNHVDYGFYYMPIPEEYEGKHNDLVPFDPEWKTPVEE